MFLRAHWSRDLPGGLKVLLACATLAVSTSACLGVGGWAGQYIDAKAGMYLLGHNGVRYHVTVEMLVAQEVSVNGVASEDPYGYAYAEVVGVQCPQRGTSSCDGPSAAYLLNLAPDEYDVANLNDITMRIPEFGGLSLAWVGNAPALPVDTTVDQAGTGGVDLESNWAAAARAQAFGTACADPSATVARHTREQPNLAIYPVGNVPPYGNVPGMPPSPARCLAG